VTFRTNSKPRVEIGPLVDRPAAPGTDGLIYVSPTKISAWDAAAAAWIDAGGGSVPNLAAVLAVGNNSGPNGIRMAVAQSIDADAALGTLHLGTANAKFIDFGNSTAAIADDDPMIVINQNGVAFNSNSGVQYSTRRPNRAQFRGNQFGANNGTAGATGFKSRGAMGSLASVNPLDPLYTITAIGVPANNTSLPIAATLALQVPAAGVGLDYVAAELELRLTPLEGPINGAKTAFKITSQGVPVLRETALPATGSTAGLAVTGVGGTIVIPNVSVKNPAAYPGTRITLTIQPGGAAPTGGVWVSNITAGVGFTIQSLTNDVGVQVYWQLWEGF